MRVLHVITGLGPGGAEHMLWRLVAATPEVEHAVFSLGGTGVLSERLQSAGATMLNGEAGRWRDLRWLRRHAAAHPPDVIQGWMYHGNLAALLARAVAPRAATFWNIRQSLTHKRFTKRSTQALIRVQAAGSRLPDAIIYNAQSAALDHEVVGFSRASRVIIPNGFDTRLFKSDAQARRAIRDELGLSEDRLAIGLIARFDPWKNHAGFFRMAEQMVERHPEVAFVLAGHGVERSNPALAAMIDNDSLRGRVFALGDRRDVAAINAGLDIACNVSHGEGFPNAIGEAMACAIPCMVTPVGASVELVGGHGAVARSTDVGDLVTAIETLASLPALQRISRGEDARRRILDHFSIEAVAKRYLNLYAGVTTPHAPVDKASADRD